MNNSIFSGLSIVDINPFYEEYGLDGVKIDFDNDKSLVFGISNGQHCCEEWGYISQVDNEDVDNYIGAKIRSIEVVDYVDGNYVSTQLKEIDAGEIDCYFLNVATTKGELNFAVYNIHNGYYGHRVTMKYDNKEMFSEIL